LLCLLNALNYVDSQLAIQKWKKQIMNYLRSENEATAGNNENEEKKAAFSRTHLSKSSRSHLDTSFIRCVNLKIVSESGMETQQAQPWLAIVT
jgi:hypothetical protein